MEMSAQIEVICNDGFDGDGTCTCVEHFSGTACEIGEMSTGGPRDGKCVYVVRIFIHFHVSICVRRISLKWLTHTTRKKNSTLEYKLVVTKLQRSNTNSIVTKTSTLQRSNTGTLETCKRSNSSEWPEAVGQVLSHCESCPANTILVEDQCVQCAAGEMINSTSGVCSNCPAGKFQNAIAHTAEECMSCRSGHYCLEAASEEIVCSGIQVCPENSKFPSSCCDANSEPDATQASCQCKAGYFALPMSFGGTSMGTEYIRRLVEFDCFV